MKISLYTDAGIAYGVATWATVVVVEGRDPVEAYGRLRDATGCSATAELRAVANALHKMIRRGELATGDVVRIYTDSASAVGRINGKHTKRPNSSMARATIVIHQLARVHGLSIKAQWVPGHKPDSHSEHAPWNNRCDALCRLARDMPAPPRISKARMALAAARRLAGMVA